MRNPLFNQSTVVSNNTMTPEVFKNALVKQGPDFLKNMVALAKQKGISQTDIDAGLRMLQAM